MPAHVGTLDARGRPRVTPLWFLWDGVAFVVTSRPAAAHVRDLRRDARASICVDVEEPEAVAGVRQNRRVRGAGTAEVFDDVGGAWTRRITEKYVPGPDGTRLADRRAAEPRMAIRLAPERLVSSGTAR